KTTRLRQRLNELFAQYGVPAAVNQAGSMMSIFFTGQKVTNVETANNTDKNLFRSFFHEMLKNGIYMPPSSFETWFVARSLENAMIDRTIEAADKSLSSILEKQNG